ncbi:hypothetical protein [Gilvibacter sediminis]|uniref:hypothetical protein n=1 Tax=Gilvibacter sediminis TaxID=379071 RepID=UPI00234FE2E5|nr:hypothetical protein [Gilvibacter sediminis]MDC7999203.1 hypothetical protein [Gilvibacter sediminis]
MRIKVLKIIVWLSLAAVLGGGLYYLQLSNRHKAIVKTTLLAKLGLSGDWQVSYGARQTDFYSPLFYVDNIYTSMEGPKAMRGFQINPTDSSLVWVNGFETSVMAADGITELSKDFMCHTNMDYYDQSYYSKWQIPNRIGSNYPRLATLTNGMESYRYPEGFGFPIRADEFLYLSTQVLNHNLKGLLFGLRHKVSIFHEADGPELKPLRPLTVFMMLPYDPLFPFDNEAAKDDPSVCIPVETKNHNYEDAEGVRRSGHWVVFPGKQIYRNDITAQLEIKDSLQVHHIATHLHPFATGLKLINATTQQVLFHAKAVNHKDRVGLEKIVEYSDATGFTLYTNQQYELVLETDNTSGERQDMMASMFFGIYDADLDARLKARFEN